MNIMQAEDAAHWSSRDIGATQNVLDSRMFLHDPDLDVGPIRVTTRCRFNYDGILESEDITMASVWMPKAQE